MQSTQAPFFPGEEFCPVSLSHNGASLPRLTKMVDACARLCIHRMPPLDAHPAKMPACDRIPTHVSLWPCTPSDIWPRCRSNGPSCSRVPLLSTSERRRANPTALEICYLRAHSVAYFGAAREYLEVLALPISHRRACLLLVCCHHRSSTIERRSTSRRPPSTLLSTRKREHQPPSPWPRSGPTVSMCLYGQLSAALRACSACWQCGHFSRLPPSGARPDGPASGGVRLGRSWVCQRCVAARQPP